MKRSSMQSKIPPEMRKQLSEDTYMRDCVIAMGCGGDTQWHHALTYSGKRINELYSIIPLCARHHKEMTKATNVICRMNVRARIAHFKALDSFQAAYPKSDLFKGV